MPELNDYNIQPGAIRLRKEANLSKVETPKEEDKVMAAAKQEDK